LQATHGKRIAVIEFGEVGIDDALLAKNAKMQVKEELIEMMNGCVCFVKNTRFYRVDWKPWKFVDEWSKNRGTRMYKRQSNEPNK
jgi:hypothetical protein